MKYMKEGKHIRKNPLLVPVIVLSIALVVETGLFIFSTPSKTSEPAEEMLQGNIVQTESDKTHIVETEDGKVVEEDFLETPYCNLYYPAQWKDSMDGTVIETGSGCKAVFTGKVADKEAEIFAIYFGENSDNAFPVGVLKTESGDKIEVNAELLDFEYDDTWNQEEIDTICAMQESINHVIAKIEEQMQSADK